MDTVPPVGPIPQSVPESGRGSVHQAWIRGGPVLSRLPRGRIESVQVHAIASFGDSETLGFWTFGTGAWITGLVELRLFPIEAMTALVPLLLVNSGVAQFVSGLFAFRRANTVTASALCSFGAVNATRGAMVLLQAIGLLHAGGYAYRLQGCLMEAYAWFAFCLIIAAVKLNRVVLAMASCTCLAFLFGALPYLADSVGHGAPGVLGQVGGGFLVATGVCAYYGGMALTVNTAWQRAVLPLGGNA